MSGKRYIDTPKGRRLVRQDDQGFYVLLGGRPNYIQNGGGTVGRSTPGVPGRKIIQSYVDDRGRQLSAHAKALINKDFSGKKIVSLIEKLSHDGYDSHGAQSDIWDLYIVVDTKSGAFEHYHYGWEHWYNTPGGRPMKQGYSLVRDMIASPQRNMHWGR